MNDKLSKGDRTEFDSRPEGEGTSLLQIEYEGHVYTEGDLVEFDYKGTGHHVGVPLIADPLGLGVAALGEARGAWADDPIVLSHDGDLMNGITNLRPVKEFSAVDLKEGGIITLRLPVDNITIAGPLERIGDCLLVGPYHVTNWRGELLDYREILDYAPPEAQKTPEWDRPEVFAVRDCEGDTWAREGQYWRTACVPDGLDSTSAENTYGPCAIHAVLAKEA